MFISSAAWMVGADAVKVGVLKFFFMDALLIFCILLLLLLTGVLLLELFVLIDVVEPLAADTNCDVVEFLFIVELDFSCLGVNVDFAVLPVFSAAVEVVCVAINNCVENSVLLFAAANAKSVLTALLDGDLVKLFLLLYMFVVNTSL